jgi:hypothetical protein
VILVSQSYDARDDRRNRELLRARTQNENSALLDVVDYVDGRDRRWTFNDLVERCDKLYHGKKCVVSNSDISFESAFGLESLITEGTLVCLTRWESTKGPRMLGHVYGDSLYSGSQDCWGFVAGTLPEFNVEIPIGRVGCDQLIAGWAVSSGMRVIDPAVSIRTFHIHSSTEREPSGSLVGFYAYPELTTASCGDSVLCHEWPPREGEELRMELRRCRQ